MKKTLLFLFLTVFALSFNSCSDDDDNGSDSQYQQVLTRTKTVEGKDTYAQSGVYVYIFMGDDYTQEKYSYAGGGAMYEGERLIKANYNAVTDKDGKSAIKANFGNKPYTVVVQRFKDSTDATKMFYIQKFDVKNVIQVVYDN